MSILRCAVLLAGCGRYDGSDVQEVVCVLHALSEAGMRGMFAPDKRVAQSINHVTGENYSEPVQNVYIESGRITGGSLATLADFDATEWDGLGYRAVLVCRRTCARFLLMVSMRALMTMCAWLYVPYKNRESRF